MTLDSDIMVRMHRGEVTPAEAFAAQSARDAAHAREAPQAAAVRARAVALLPKSVLEHPIGRGLIDACACMGIALECHECYEGYRERHAAAHDLITWGVKWPHERYAGGWRNVLYVENGLLQQRAGRYVDHRGFFCDSSIVADEEWRRTVSDSERAAMREHLVREFGWDASATFDPGGPILIALQTPQDAPLQYYCQRPAGLDGRQYVIDAAAEHLPDGVEVIVRPHPRDETPDDGFRVPAGWRIERGGDVYRRLRECRAIVTANSTLAFEAMALGMPVACLGRHVYSGSGAVLECDGRPERLAELLAWRPDPAAVEGLMAAVMRHMLSPRASAQDWLANASFAAWARECLRRAEVARARPARSNLERRYQAACQRIRASNDLVMQAMLDATEREIDRNCAPCSRGRLMRRMIDVDLSIHGGRPPVFGPVTIDRLAAAGLDVWRPDLRGYGERLRAARAANQAARPEIGEQVVLGFMYGAHLGDTMCTTVLAQPLADCGHAVSVVRWRHTYAAFAEHQVRFRNEGRMRLSPPDETGKGHLAQRLLRWFGFQETAYPRPDLRISTSERAWAADVLRGLPRPIILVSPEAVSNADGYAAMPWQEYADILGEAGSVVHLRQYGEALQGCLSLGGLDTRQYMAICADADAYLGTWAAGIHCAAAFGLEAVVVCTDSLSRDAIEFPSPSRHIVSFLYPQHAYGWARRVGSRAGSHHQSQREGVGASDT